MHDAEFLLRASEDVSISAFANDDNDDESDGEMNDVKREVKSMSTAVAQRTTNIRATPLSSTNKSSLTFRKPPSPGYQQAIQAMQLAEMEASSSLYESDVSHTFLL